MMLGFTCGELVLVESGVLNGFVDRRTWPTATYIPVQLCTAPSLNVARAFSFRIIKKEASMVEFLDCYNCFQS